MQRRRFLEFAGRLGAGLGIASPWLGPETLQAFPGTDTVNRHSDKRMNKGAGTAPTLVTSLDGDWLIATDPGNAGREQKWFLAPRPEAKRTPVPSIIQEAFPAYHGVVWCWRKFDAPPQPYAS